MQQELNQLPNNSNYQQQNPNAQYRGSQYGQPQQQGYGQQGQFNQGNQQNRAAMVAKKDYSVPPANYKPPLYPREQLPDNAEENLDLGGTYQKYLYCLGNCCGSLKTVCPCFICCVDYPYRQIDQSFVGVYQRFGRYIKTENPGLLYVNPCTDTLQQVDMKTQCLDLARQIVLTKDNIEATIDAIVYYRIVFPKKAIYSVQNIPAAVSQLTFSTFRSICGQYTLQGLLESRQQITELIEQYVDVHTWDWGIDIENMLIKDIKMSAQLQENLSAVTKEQRLAQSKIINAQADVQSAKLMREAAEFLDSKAAMQIRYLETISILGQQGSTKVVFLPDEQVH